MKIINMTIDEIKNIPMVELITIPFSKEKDDYDFPNKVSFYYWDKGYEPDQVWLKSDLKSDDCYVDSVSDVINSKEEREKAIDGMRLELIDSTIREKFNLICEENINIISEATTPINEDFMEINKFKAIELLSTSKDISEEIKKELVFYNTLFENDFSVEPLKPIKSVFSEDFVEKVEEEIRKELENT